LQADDWSDDDGNDNASPADRSKEDDQNLQPDLNHALLEIKRLKEHLLAARRDLTDYRTLVNTNIINIAGGALGDITVEQIRTEELPPTPPRDDDTHYFESYSDQGKGSI
jgi:type I protein arginine methyltransferase